MPRLRLGLRSLLLLPATRRFSRGGPWMWAPFGLSGSLVALAKVRFVPNSVPEQLLRKEMAFERAFVKAGGLLLAGPDPTGIGGVLPGFGDQRELELLVEAGFTPIEAIHIATANGAAFLGRLDRIGTLAPSPSSRPRWMPTTAMMPRPSRPPAAARNTHPSPPW